MNRLVEMRPTTGLWVALGLVAAVCMASYFNVNATRRERESVTHAMSVRLALAQTLSNLQDAETGQRGYLLTSNQPYLQPYYVALKQLPVNLAKLRQLARGNADQLRRIDSIEAMADEKLSELARTIELRQQNKPDEALLVVHSNFGKHVMDDIRKAIKGVDEQEKGTLAAREDSVQRVNSNTVLTIVGGNIVLFLIIGLSTYIILNDLTRRKKVEAALRISEEHYSTTLRSIGDAVMATDATGKVTFMNKVAEELTGWQAEEAAGQDSTRVFDIVNMETRNVVESPITKVIREGTIVGLANHTVLLAKDGREIHIDDSGAPIRDDSGKLTGIVLVFRDISERVIVEQERAAHLAEIEDLNTRLRRALAETHHRVKNNLQIISALVDVQTFQHEETVPISELNRLIQHIRALAAVHDLLTQHAKDGQDASDVSAKEVLNKLVQLLQPLVEGRRIIAQADDITVPIKQATSLVVLVNELISNAIKHGKGDILLTFEVQDGGMKLVVCDDGPGFPEDFSPQTNANTGVDLIESLSRWDLHGQTAYENQPAGGARVVVTIPLIKTSS